MGRAGRPRVPRLPCAAEDCGKPAKARGLCVTHYQREWRCGRTDTGVRNPDQGGFVCFVRFTPALWDRWLREQEPDQQTYQLRAGIAEMRRLIALRDAKYLPPPRQVA